MHALCVCRVHRPRRACGHQSGGVHRGMDGQAGGTHHSKHMKTRGTYAMVHIRRSEDDFVESCCSSHCYVGSGDPALGSWLAQLAQLHCVILPVLSVPNGLNLY